MFYKTNHNYDYDLYDKSDSDKKIEAFIHLLRNYDEQSLREYFVKTRKNTSMISDGAIESLVSDCVRIGHHQNNYKSLLLYIHSCPSAGDCQSLSFL